MAKERRNSISHQRRSILKQPGVVYTIRCPGTHCDCAQFGSECRRGFFSLWIQAVYGRYFAKKFLINSYIDFGDKPYLYSDPARFDGQLNFWNYYYLQKSTKNGRTIPNNYMENYPLRIWKRSHFKLLHSLAVEDLVLNEVTQTYIDSLTAPCTQHSTLGVHIRGTDHQVEVPPVPLTVFISLLRKNQHKFQKFYVSTDDQRVLEQLIEEFGEEKLIFQNAIRSTDQDAIHTNMDHTNRYRLGLEVLADCYALSACKQALLVHSNVSYATLLLNPRLKYRLLESGQAKKARLKTGFLYILDRWGVRKM